MPRSTSPIPRRSSATSGAPRAGHVGSVTSREWNPPACTGFRSSRFSRGAASTSCSSTRVKNVPGRKTDVVDCQWIQELHSVGLLRGSFRPTAAIAALRAYLRHRETLVQSAATHVQRMQKALVQMNLQLPIVISDITGVTGLRILRDIVGGQTDPHALAQHRDPGVR